MHVKWPKVRVVLVTKTENVLAGETPGAISPNFCVSAHRDTSVIFPVLSVQIRSGFEKIMSAENIPLELPE